MEANDKDLAEFARLGLRFRILAPTSITTWADGIIADGDIPEPWLIDLAVPPPRPMPSKMRRARSWARRRATSRSASSLRWSFAGGDQAASPSAKSADRLAAALRIGDPRTRRPSRLGRLSGSRGRGTRRGLAHRGRPAGASIDEKLAAYSGLIGALPPWA